MVTIWTGLKIGLAVGAGVGGFFIACAVAVGLVIIAAVKAGDWL